ncbi:MAG: hypothetical protein LBI81_02420 [Puniceicoccales bacterium]|jgi:hypothetical protein|nr:hypothetical protein [Puniceicoccales bacterium]
MTEIKTAKVDTEGYEITNQMIANVTNNFIDLSEAEAYYDANNKLEALREIEEYLDGLPDGYSVADATAKVRNMLMVAGFDSGFIRGILGDNEEIGKEDIGNLHGEIADLTALIKDLKPMTFYFLEGTYDQITLQKIYEALTSSGNEAEKEKYLKMLYGDSMDSENPEEYYNDGSVQQLTLWQLLKDATAAAEASNEYGAAKLAEDALKVAQEELEAAYDDPAFGVKNYTTIEQEMNDAAKRFEDQQRVSVFTANGAVAQGSEAACSYNDLVDALSQAEEMYEIVKHLDPSVAANFDAIKAFSEVSYFYIGDSPCADGYFRGNSLFSQEKRCFYVDGAYLFDYAQLFYKYCEVREEYLSSGNNKKLFSDLCEALSILFDVKFKYNSSFGKWEMVNPTETGEGIKTLAELQAAAIGEDESKVVENVLGGNETTIEKTFTIFNAFFSVTVKIGTSQASYNAVKHLQVFDAYGYAYDEDYITQYPGTYYSYEDFEKKYNEAKTKSDEAYDKYAGDASDTNYDAYMALEAITDAANEAWEKAKNAIFYKDNAGWHVADKQHSTDANAMSIQDMLDGINYDIAAYIKDCADEVDRAKAAKITAFNTEIAGWSLPNEKGDHSPASLAQLEVDSKFKATMFDDMMNTVLDFSKADGNFGRYGDNAENWTLNKLLSVDTTTLEESDKLNLSRAIEWAKTEAPFSGKTFRQVETEYYTAAAVVDEMEDEVRAAHNQYAALTSTLLDFQCVDSYISALQTGIDGIIAASDGGNWYKGGGNGQVAPHENHIEAFNLVLTKCQEFISELANLKSMGGTLDEVMAAIANLKTKREATFSIDLHYYTGNTSVTGYTKGEQHTLAEWIEKISVSSFSAPSAKDAQKAIQSIGLEWSKIYSFIDTLNTGLGTINTSIENGITALIEKNCISTTFRIEELELLLSASDLRNLKPYLDLTNGGLNKDNTDQDKKDVAKILADIFTKARKKEQDAQDLLAAKKDDAQTKLNVYSKAQKQGAAGSKYNDCLTERDKAQEKYNEAEKAYENSEAYKAMKDANLRYNGVFREYNKLVAESGATEDDLLELCLMASTPAPNASGTYTLVSGIQKVPITNENGEINYEYRLDYGDKKETITEIEYQSSFSKSDGYKHRIVSYIAMAIMYEKVCIQQLVLVEQMDEVEKMNERIHRNNEAIKALSWMYEQVYAKAVDGSITGQARRGSISSEELFKSCGITMEDLNSYMENEVKNGGIPRGDASLYQNFTISYELSDGDSVFNFAVGHYNKDGDKWTAKDAYKGDIGNVDVQEQAVLTFITNSQDQTRLFGDKLSTDANLMTTKMQQYIQEANTCLNTITQAVKTVGDVIRGVANNIRW